MEIAATVSCDDLATNFGLLWLDPNILEPPKLDELQREIDVGMRGDLSETLEALKQMLLSYQDV